MIKILLKIVGGLLALSAVLLVAVFVLSVLYSSSENRNFKKMRQKSSLDCAALPLHCLIRLGDATGINAYMASGRNLEIRDGWGQTALFFALKQDETEIGKLLLMHGADPNTLNESGESILREATRINEFEFADNLLAFGANIDAVDHTRHHLTANPDSRFVDSGFSTAIHNCIRFERIECIIYLIKNGADLEVEDSYGYTPRQRIDAHAGLSHQLEEYLR